MKILFAVNLLKGIGGIESSLINLINNLDKSKYEIDLCVMGNYISDTTEIPKNVNIIKGNKIIEYCCCEYKDIAVDITLVDKVVLIFMKILKRIIGYKPILQLALKFMKRDKYYDIAISYSNDIYKKVYSGGCDDYILKCVNSQKKIAWIHNDAREHGLTYHICKDKYSEFDSIVNVSEGCKEIFDNIIPDYTYKSKVVTNMINVDNIEKKRSINSPYEFNFNIVTVARIDNQQKRIDRIIESCAILRQKGITNFKWYIIGDGPDLDMLIEQARMLNLLDIIEFVGRKSNPIPYIEHADLFVQTSDYEAYSMVLIEALAVGTPCLCTNYESAKDIIIDGYNGLIVEKDSNEISNSILELMNNKELLIKLRGNCKKSSMKLNKKSLISFEELVN